MRGSRLIEEYRQRGAAYFVEINPEINDPELRTWLSNNGSIVYKNLSESGKEIKGIIYKLLPVESTS